MRVRRARPEDDAALAAVDAVTWTSGTSPGGARTAGSAFFDERTAPADVLVAEQDGQVVGYVLVRQAIPLPSHTHVLQVDGLAVHPDSRGRGVGSALVGAAVAEARSRGARKLSLRVLATNSDAQRLYARCGFAIEGVLREEFLLDGRYVDDRLMARALDVD